MKFTKYTSSGAYHWKLIDPQHSSFSLTLLARYEVIRAAVGNANRLLDLGCGDGAFLGLLTETPHVNCRMLAGLDAEPEAIELARQLLIDRPNVSLKTGSCYSLPWEENTFDCIIMSDVIEHLEDPDEALKECKRCLVNQGKLLLTTPVASKTRGIVDPFHIHEYRAAELIILLKKHFHHVRIRPFDHVCLNRAYRTAIGQKTAKSIHKIGYNICCFKLGPDSWHRQMLAVAVVHK